jgi:hypothetical protein
MAISLTTANGDPVSLFGSGSSQFAMGQKTNAFEANANPFDYAADKSAPGQTLLSPRTFGDSTDPNQGAATQTVAGSTAGLGYGDLRDTKAPRGTRRGGGGGGGAKPGGDATAALVPDAADESGQIGLKPAEPGEAPTPSTPTHQLQTRIGGDSSDGPKFRIAKVGNNTPGPMGRNDTFGASAQASRTGSDMPGSMPSTETTSPEPFTAT